MYTHVIYRLYMIISMDEDAKKQATYISNYDHNGNGLRAPGNKTNLESISDYASLGALHEKTLSLIGHTTNSRDTVGDKTAKEIAINLGSKYVDKSQLNDIFLIACEGSIESTQEGFFANKKQKSFAQKLADELFSLGFENVNVYSARAPEDATAIRVTIDTSNGVTQGKVGAVAYMNKYTEDYENNKDAGIKTKFDPAQYNSQKLMENKNGATSHQQSFKEHFVPFISTARAIKILEIEYKSSEDDGYKKQIQSCINNLQKKDLTSIPEDVVKLVNHAEMNQKRLSSTITPKQIVDAKLKIAETDNDFEIKMEKWNKRYPIIKAIVTLIWGDQAKVFADEKKNEQQKPLQVINEYDKLTTHINEKFINECLKIVDDKKRKGSKEDLHLYKELESDFVQQKADVKNNKQSSISKLKLNWTFASDVSDAAAKLIGNFSLVVTKGAEKLVQDVSSVINMGVGQSKNQGDIENLKQEIDLYVNKKGKEKGKIAVMTALQTYVAGIHNEEAWKGVTNAISANPNYADRTGFTESTVKKMVERVKKVCPVLSFESAYKEYETRRARVNETGQGSPKSVSMVYESNSMSIR